MSDLPLWMPGPERVAASQLMAFMQQANRRHELALESYADLHLWSITQPGAFWNLLWDFCGVVGEKG
ncbi:MAG: hypothetical protein K8F62_05070, partial [Pseudorhodoplanes sp.]|nr:hypothetical protein [Pseudorhodoplanes sp.]